MSNLLTLASEIAVTLTTFRPNTRRILSDTRVAIGLNTNDPGVNGLTEKVIVVDGPRALGPVQNFLYLEGTGPFIIETAHLDHENPLAVKVVRTPIQRLYLSYCQMVAVSLLPAADIDPLKPVQVRALFG